MYLKPTLSSPPCALSLKHLGTRLATRPTGPLPAALTAAACLSAQSELKPVELCKILYWNPLELSFGFFLCSLNSDHITDTPTSLGEPESQWISFIWRHTRGRWWTTAVFQCSLPGGYKVSACSSLFKTYQATEEKDHLPKYTSSQSFRSVCKYIFHMLFHLLHVHVYLHCVPSNPSPPRFTARRRLPQQFQTAAMPLNQPARETFPHSLSKCRLPPSPLNQPGLRPRMGNIQFWTNDNFSLQMRMWLCLAFSFPATQS